MSADSRRHRSRKRGRIKSKRSRHAARKRQRRSHHLPELTPPAPDIAGVEVNNLNKRSDEAYNVRLFGGDFFELFYKLNLGRLEPPEASGIVDTDESVEFDESEIIPQYEDHIDDASISSEPEIMILYRKETLVNPDSDLSDLDDSMDSQEIEEYWSDSDDANGHVDKHDLSKYSETEETVDTDEFFEAEDTTGHVDEYGTKQYPEPKEIVDNEDYIDAEEATSYVAAADDDYDYVDESEDTNGYTNGIAETTEYVDANGTESHREDLVDTERYAVTEDATSYVVNHDHVVDSDDVNGYVDGTVGNSEYPNADGAELYHEIEEVVNTEERLGTEKIVDNERYREIDAFVDPDHFDEVEDASGYENETYNHTQTRNANGYVNGSNRTTNSETENIVETVDYFDAEDASGHVVKNNHADEPEDNGFMNGNVNVTGHKEAVAVEEDAVPQSPLYGGLFVDLDYSSDPFEDSYNDETSDPLFQPLPTPPHEDNECPADNAEEPRIPVVDISLDDDADLEPNKSDAVTESPKVNVFKHAETGLVVCAEGHDPIVLLASQISVHLRSRHGRMVCTDETRLWIREELLKGTATNIPLNILTPLPGIPILQKPFCHRCRTVSGNVWTHEVKQPECVGSKRDLVRSQRCSLGKWVIVGSVPEDANPSQLALTDVTVNITKHDETGLLVCAEGHKPMVVLPHEISQHMLSLHSDSNTAIRAKVLQVLNTGTVTKVPPNIQTKFPAIPVVTAYYCLHCKKVTTLKGHATTDKCFIVQVKCQIYAQKRGVVIGQLPQTHDVHDSVAVDLKIKKHKETGLLVCAENHKPTVVLPDRVHSHIKHNHTGERSWSAKLQAEITKLLSTCTVSAVPSSIRTPLPLIPVVQGKYCLGCYRVFEKDFTHNGEDKCGDNNQVAVVCQFYQRGKAVIIGSTPNDRNGNSDDIADNTVPTRGSIPNESNDNMDDAMVNSAPTIISHDRDEDEENAPQLDVFTHPETGLCVCAHGHNPVVVPPSYVRKHLQRRHVGASESLLARIRRRLRESPATEVPPNIQTRLPAIPVVTANYCIHCKRTYMNKKYHNETADCVSTRVQCQYHNRYNTVIIGRIPDRSDVVGLSDVNEGRDELRDPVDSDVDLSDSARELFSPGKSDNEPIGVGNHNVPTSYPETFGRERPSSENSNQQRSGPELTQIEAGINIMKHTETGLFICAHDHDPMVVLPYQINNHINSRHSGKQGGSRELRSKIRGILQRCAVNGIPTNIRTRLPAIPISSGEYCFGCREVNGDWSHDDSKACKNNRRVQVDCQICYPKKAVVVGPLPEIPRDRRLGGP